jgi:RimJ/RimL family protein N-acetyltransferase
MTQWPGCEADLKEITIQILQLGQVNETILNSVYSDGHLRLYSRCFKLDGRAVGILGLTPRWDGYALGWALFSEEILQYPVELCRESRSLMERFRWMLALRRLEITVDTQHETALRWARFLGFEQEGILRCYGLAGEDAYLMARIWK